MPVTPEEVLHKLTAAVEEAKGTIREVHTARADLLGLIKKERAALADAIQSEVESQVSKVTSDVSEQARRTISEAINGIVSDWRQKLGLDES